MVDTVKKENLNKAEIVNFKLNFSLSFNCDKYVTKDYWLSIFLFLLFFTIQKKNVGLSICITKHRSIIISVDSFSQEMIMINL